VLLASVSGTTIEFFDFYIYATAAVLVFPKLFFPASDPEAAQLQSFATFAVAFYARPLGSAVFGHFGDRVGRKATLVAAILTMGLATVTIGLLPGYAAIGTAAPLALAACRFLQGFGLGGEWGGAVLLATENAPAGRKAWYGMFPQLGAPIGFLFSGTCFLVLSSQLSNEQFIAFGWRLPFLLSSLLIGVGLWVRLRITETPAFQAAIAREERVAVPLVAVVRHQFPLLVLGSLAALSVFVLFYLLTVFTLSWGTGHLHYARSPFLVYQLIGIVFFGAAIPLSATAADKRGRRRTLMIVSAVMMVLGLGFGPLFSGGTAGVLATLIVGFAVMGLAYGPLGTFLAELFPTAVRYTGASICFNVAGILGASLAPYVATKLADRFGLAFVGYYLAAAALVTLVALACCPRD
jgi:MFS family permease